MEILSVHLTNFKSHQDAIFEFQPGTNAIYGENGAGKTSILEAIAWTLFNHSNYPKDEMIRKGTKSAQVSVKFVSNLDARTYEVRRCSSKGYGIYDPQLKQKLSYTKVDDVTQWLREHLGVEKGTDLAKLFGDTIGIPQGTFTIDFLKNAGDRKKVFDPILNVEEYKQAAVKAKELESYALGKIEQSEQELTRCEMELQDWDALKVNYQRITQEIEQQETQLQGLAQGLEELQTQKDQLKAIATQIQSLTLNLTKLEGEKAGKFESCQRLTIELELAQAAANLCQELQPQYQLYQQIELNLNQLYQDAERKRKLLTEQNQYRQTLEKQRVNLERVKADLDHLANARNKLAELQPLVEQQIYLEEQRDELKFQLQNLENQKIAIQNLQHQLEEHQASQSAIATEIHRLERLQSSCQVIPQLEQEINRYQAQLSRIEAAQQFEAELKQLVSQGETRNTAYLSQSQAILNLIPDLNLKNQVASMIQQGVDNTTHLINVIQQILADLGAQISVEKIQAQIQATQKNLKALYQNQAEFATLETKLTDQDKLTAKIQEIQTSLNSLTLDLSQEQQLKTRLEQVNQRLKFLNNPHATCDYLQQELQKEASLQTRYQQFLEKITEAEQQIERSEQQLQPYHTLETEINQQNQQKQHYQDAYLAYLKQQETASKQARIQQEIAQEQTRLQQIEQQITQFTEQQAKLSENYHPEQLEALETEYNQQKSNCDRLQGSLPLQKQEQQRLSQELTKRQSLADQYEQLKLTLIKQQQTHQLIRDARQIYSNSSTRITKFYLQEISREADKIFRELMNRANVALEWTEDYEIVLQEGGYKRSFRSLSGGEQMCAALAVRLALLRTLANIDIAFFDEPTTNMDLPRRRQLADAIANIKTFRQLFVISHDDTFENLSHFIEVKRS